MLNVKTLTFNSPLLNDVFNRVENPPNQLYYAGDLQKCLNQPRIAIVGSRKVTSYGRSITAKLAREAAEQGITVVSGLALGVDSVAHQGTLEAGGRTIAVLPSGLERIYPASHHSLARHIVECGGALVSEYPGTSRQAFKGNFVARNRIVSALSDAILITEAAVGSGSLHTANFAKAQGKILLAVPGNVTSPQSEGTNNLIKAGATIVTNFKDILSAMGLKQNIHKSLPVGTNDAEDAILKLIYSGVSDASELQVKSGLGLVAFNQSLTMLEISGKISNTGNKWAIS